MSNVRTTMPPVAALPPRSLFRLPNPKVVWSLLFPAARRLWLQRDKDTPQARVRCRNTAHFNWRYGHDQPELHKLYEAAKRDQWNATTALDWDTSVDPHDPGAMLLDPHNVPMADIPAYQRMSPHEQSVQRHGFACWLLSQFLHGEQGALFAACEVTEAIHWADGKLYGSTQVVDEGRHVEVFHRYLADKMQKIYPINDNLFTIIDSLVSDGRWDMKFLGMQIMIEGLALGAFGVLRRNTKEPLLRQLLRYVITDEARHVHYGVTALSAYYATLNEPQRREREDWAFEVAVLMRNRFLAHEFYEEHYGHCMTRNQWNKVASESRYMALFRDEMFRRLVPNLKRIHLLSDRIRPHYQKLGLLRFEREKAAPELAADELFAS